MGRFAALILVGFLAACSSAKVATKSPESAVYSATLGYMAALEAMDVYASLPPCSEEQGPPCRDAEVVDKMVKADDTAYAVLQAAQAAVRDESVPEELKGTIAESAANAVSTLLDILRRLGVMKE